MNYSKIIYENFLEQYPDLVDAINQAVQNGESRSRFIEFIKKTFGKDYNTSLTASASITIFDYLKQLKK